MVVPSICGPKVRYDMSEIILLLYMYRVNAADLLFSNETMFTESENLYMSIIMWY